jgi:hypothetical protein
MTPTARAPQAFHVMRGRRGSRIAAARLSEQSAPRAGYTLRPEVARDGSVRIWWVAVLVGVAFVVFRKRLGELQVGSQNEFWGFRMGARSVAASRWVFLVAGIVAIVTEALVLAGVGGFKA